jgi:hypothetical protein
MKRGFLFGLGTFLILMVFFGLVGFASDRGGEALVKGILGLICMPLSLVTIRAAQRAPLQKSRWRLVTSWLVGFLCLDLIVLGLVALFIVAAHLFKVPA